MIASNVHPTTIRSDVGGAFYAKVGARDEAGNVSFTVVGPWYAGTVGDPFLPWQNNGQTIRNTLDGVVDIQAQEYLTPTEWLDDDIRPLTTQSLYTAWDGSQQYVAWQGADWTSDGTMWVYYDLLDGGTTMPVEGAVMLPFSADVAVKVEVDQWQNAVTTRYEFSGSAWEQSGWASGAYDANSLGIEYRMNTNGLASDTSQYANHRMMAFALTDAGEVWSAFPTSNALNGMFETYYE